MLGNLDVVRMANQLAAHAAGRQAFIARNVANADTPGYRAVDLAVFDPRIEGRAADLRQTRSTHLAGRSGSAPSAELVDVGGPTSPNGNSVSVEAEMVRGAEVMRQHDLALSVYSTALGIMRTAIGRAR